MPATQPQVCSAPFDAVASRYDETFTSSIIGQAQRAAVWKELTRAFQAGDRVLEIGCGTGVDACHLAERGVEVLACDASSQMIEVAAHRARQSDLQALVHTRTLRAEDIDLLSSDESFDGAFSNFGALNCVTDLRSVAEGLARLVKPGGIALLCWMGPCCLWETLFYLGQGEISKAFRRFHRNGVNARITDNSSLQIHYPSVRTLARSFGAGFRLKSVHGIGVAIPPSYLESWARRHQRTMKLCEGFDFWFGDWPGLRLLGDHVLVKLERRHTESAGAS
jgi:ubiquinone/menaquinone biosynthesis C-methylase UbiE